MKQFRFRWIFITFLLVILMSGFVSAAQTDITQIYTEGQGVEIEYPKKQFYNNEDGIKLNFDIHNSTGYHLDDSEVDCEIVVNKGNGKTISYGPLIHNTTTDIYEYKLNESCCQSIGEYSFFAHCNSTQNEAGFVSSNFIVTENGRRYDSSDGMMYLTLVMFAVISSFVFIGFGTSNIRFGAGDFVNLVLKRASIILGFLLLSVTSTMIYSIQNAFDLSVGISVYRFVWIFLLASLLMMIYTVIKTLFDVIEMYGQRKENKRMGGNL